MEPLTRRAALLSIAGAAPVLGAARFASAQQVVITNNAVDENDPLFPYAFLLGRWIGDADGSLWSETWNPPSAGTMLGSAKWSVGAQTRFFEIKTLEMDAKGNVFLFARHFNAGLVPWEAERDAPVTLRLVDSAFEMGPGNTFKEARAVFEREPGPANPRRRLTYRYAPPGILSAIVEDHAGKQWQTRMTVAFKRSPVP